MERPDVMQLKMINAKVEYFRNAFEAEDSARLFAALLQEINWKQESIKMFGKTIPMPRLTAWYGDGGEVYSYSGITHTALAWTPSLSEIKRRIEPLAAVRFNSVLLNYYRNGRDSMSWHADDEPELGSNPVIGSVSFGQSRRFYLKHKLDPTQRVSIVLDDGSFLLMAGETQHHWLHQIPKSKKPLGERINLTFRIVHPSSGDSRRSR